MTQGKLNLLYPLPPTQFSQAGAKRLNAKALGIPVLNQVLILEMKLGGRRKGDNITEAEHHKDEKAGVRTGGQKNKWTA